jgi:thioredoxin 1
MSGTITVSTADWETEVLKSDTPVLVDFWAEWCPPCHMIAPVVEQLAVEQAGKLKVVKLNTDENPEITRQYRVMSIPTLIVFSDGGERKRIVGARGKQQLESDVAEFIGG